MNGYWDGPLPEAQVRTIDDMRQVLADRTCTANHPLYYMYRHLAKSDDDRRWLEEQRISYDITAIPPGTLCGEYVKTKGHLHPDNPAGLGYPEIYEVLQGRGHYLLQTRDAGDVIMIEASAGDKVLIPPGYGHVTINPGSKVLVMSNLVSTAFASDYQPYVDRNGAAYYEMEGGALVKNPKYPHAAPVRHLPPIEVRELSIDRTTPLYDLVGRARSVAFLNHPEQFMEIFAELTNYPVPR
ncbi:glucose-6-phosphate isomerase [Methanoculleus taiwanensis]|uniref:glucose-6-phosphate isomerase n=1 Tax=Methanoculleus taiwanensis TaxID=1550565 RepID=A0A498H2V8_9EURY|nr:glucose-6-phosphate isomerase family protein [Methanoculleus taiwanensis]RXE57143.1 glucose-6-phosphate isomerase [Methanoculleus taiwanensis]